MQAIAQLPMGEELQKGYECNMRNEKKEIVNTALVIFPARPFIVVLFGACTSGRLPLS